MTAREFLDAVRAAADVDAALAQHASLFDDSEGDCEAFREEVAALLWRDCRATDRPLLRALVAAETARALEYDGCGGTLQALAFMLYRLGNPEDVFLLCEAKYANFDTGCMLDGELLRMGRERDAMLAFVDERLATDPTLTARPERLRDALVAAYEHATYESDEEFRASATSYFDEYFGVG